MNTTVEFIIQVHPPFSLSFHSRAHFAFSHTLNPLRHNIFRLTILAAQVQYTRLVAPRALIGRPWCGVVATPTRPISARHFHYIGVSLFPSQGEVSECD